RRGPLTIARSSRRPPPPRRTPPSAARSLSARSRSSYFSPCEGPERGRYFSPPPHTFANPPPPQMSPGDVHVPQSRRPPHPSAALPQLKPRMEHVFGTQLGVTHLPPMHSSVAAHTPQLSEPPQVSPASPH